MIFPARYELNHLDWALTKGKRSRDKNGMLNDDRLMEYANASHIERADRSHEKEKDNRNYEKEMGKSGKMNGDSVAVEAAKTVNPSPGILDPEIKLNVEDITMLRSDSVNSINTSSGRSSRLGRVFHTRHAKSSKNRGNQPRGEVEMSIRYADAIRKLVVQVLGARNLLPWEKEGQCNPYATVKLISVEHNKELAKRKTGVVKNSLNPVFDNHFEFDMDAQDSHNYKLQILIKDDTNYGAFSSKPVLGQVGFYN
ncbi:C2 domain protein [Teladorsagia circumcincta]|uniref:C2 domain protein n=1 Tax=Teladorsagia circumcincta TaxID=45464 RepID=A0A2G9TRS7_TELCI|nr:C2 domain protein [Teladorsagia circumcincta]